MGQVSESLREKMILVKHKGSSSRGSWKERKDDEATSGNEIEKKRGDGWPMMGDGNDENYQSKTKLVATSASISHTVGYTCSRSETHNKVSLFGTEINVPDIILFARSWIPRLLQCS
ncbi:hypothetical protein LguiB_000420 [Lonicera macranthoides]